MDFDLRAELRVLVQHRVKAVRAGRDDLLDAVPVERLDVLRRQDLEQVLIAEPPGRVARARLLVAKHGEVHSSLLQHVRHRPRHLRVALVQRSRAANPEEHLCVRVVRHGRDVQALHPVRARHRRAAPRVAALLQALQRRLRRRGHPRLFHGEVAAHVHDGVDVVDADGTGLNAGPAGRAGPELVLPNCVGDHRHRRLGQRLACRRRENLRRANLHVAL